MTTSPHAERWHDKPRGEQATFHAAFENFSDSIFAINDQGHSLTLEPATCIDDIDLASSVGCIDPYFSSLQQDEFSIDMSILEHLTEDPAVPIVAHDLSATGNEAIHDDSEGSQQEQENCTDHNSPDICQPPDNINVAQAQNREGNRGEARNSSSQHFSAKRARKEILEPSSELAPSVNRQAKRLKCSVSRVAPGHGVNLPDTESAHDGAPQRILTSTIISPFLDILVALPLPNTIVHETVTLKSLSSMAKRLRDQGQEHGYKNIVPISSGTATRMQDRIAYAIMLLNNKTREIKFYTIQSRDATKRLHKGITVSFCRTVKKVYDIQDSVGHHSGNEQLYSCSPLDRLLFELLGFDFIPASGDRLYEVLDEYARDVVNDDEQRTQTCPDVKLQDSVLFRDMDTHQDIRERLLPYRDANLLLDLIQTYLTGNAESVRAAEEALQTMTSKLLHLDRQLFPEAAAQITDALEHLRKSLHRVRKLENFISKAKQNTRRVSEAKEAYTAQLRTHLRDLESIEGI